MRTWRYALALALIAATPAALHACSCASYEPVKACQMYHTMPVIVRARIVDHNLPQRGPFNQRTLYRFAVVEAFKGLAPRVPEILIDPGTGGSCYTEFTAGVDYLFYLDDSHQFPADSIAQLDRPTPAAWTPTILSGLPLFIVGVCGPMRIIAQPSTDPDLLYLREARRFTPATPGWVEGRAVLPERSGRLSEFLPAPGVTVKIASDRLRVQHSVTVPANGYFRSPLLAPGLYTIAPRSSVLGAPQHFTQTKEQVFPGGCVVANASFETRAVIRGKVFDAQGKPAPGVHVESAELTPGAKTHGPARTWTETSPDGTFLLEQLPLGPVVVGANLNGAPTQYKPYDPTYAPGPFNMKPGETRTGVVLKLPPPLPFGDLEVEVLWPDGTPARDTARASADLGEAHAGFADADPGSHIVRLPLALGRKYNIRAEWYRVTQNRRSVYLDPTPPQPVYFTRNGQRIAIRLTEPRPPE